MHLLLGAMGHLDPALAQLEALFVNVSKLTLGRNGHFLRLTNRPFLKGLQEPSRKPSSTLLDRYSNH
ncbi:hypothetical protein [Hymenobacter crusticola]|uniref:Uncharacterized protein n=1 Tax=Hymenobacter crusticola TaxID=1770526 RepID=A0A243W6B2_9BACT|nr:hypothetical protein [Hymenobacter crusticola]OUJ69820.1 hypothetical protein BXP70_25950 [Hymenobacter crusticola]